MRRMTICNVDYWPYLCAPHQRAEKFNTVVLANGYRALPLLSGIEGFQTYRRILQDPRYYSILDKNSELLDADLGGLGV